MSFRNFIRRFISLLQFLCKLSIFLYIIYSVYFYFQYKAGTFNHLINNLNNISDIKYDSGSAFFYELLNGDKYIIKVDAVIASYILPHVLQHSSFNLAKIANMSSLLSSAFYIYFFLKIFEMIKPAPDVPMAKNTTKLSDLVGMNSVKKEIIEIIKIHQNTETNNKLKLQIPKGILLSGAPGNGKTMLAKAMAGEMNCELFYASASEFMELYVGSGPRAVRELFRKAKHYGKPCIVFVDEIDSICRRRGSDSNTERQSTLNELLVHLDGLSTDNNILFVCASNHIDGPDGMDPALHRRLEVHIPINDPNIFELEELIKFYVRDIKISSDFDPKEFAEYSEGQSRANVKTVIDGAKRIASSDSRNYISLQDLHESRLNLEMGRRTENFILPVTEMLRTCIHEAGHLVMHWYYYQKGVFNSCASFLSVEPRAMTLGHVSWSHKGEYTSYTDARINAEMQVCYGGLVAEKIANYQDLGPSIGCSSDLKKARSMAEHYVNYGLSGMSVGVTSSSYSSELEQSEKFKNIQNLCDKNLSDCLNILKSNWRHVEEVAKHAFYLGHLTKSNIMKILQDQIFNPDYRLVKLERVFINK